MATMTAKLELQSFESGTLIGTTETTLLWASNGTSTGPSFAGLPSVDCRANRMRELTLLISPSGEALTSLKIYGKVHSRSSTWVPIAATYADFAGGLNKFIRHSAVYNSSNAYVDADATTIPDGGYAIITLSVGTFAEIKATSTSAGGTALISAYLTGYEHAQDLASEHMLPQTLVPQEEDEDTTGAWVNIALPANTVSIAVEGDGPFYLFTDTSATASTTDYGVIFAANTTFNITCRGQTYLHFRRVNAANLTLTWSAMIGV
jgi:hypothetical protein